MSVPIKGLTYVLKNKLYIALTNKCVSKSIIDLRGPSFQMPSSSNFIPLEKEPSAQDVYTAVDNAFEQGIVGVSSMDSDEITFAGIGEPLLKIDTMTDAARMIIEKRHGAQLRVKTSGLIKSSDSFKVCCYNFSCSNISGMLNYYHYLTIYNSILLLIIQTDSRQFSRGRD